MARDSSLDILFEPVRIGPKVLRNRFYAVPHSSGFGSERPASQAAFRAMKAEGGWAAVNVEITSIEPASDRNPVPQPVRLWDDDDAANLAATAAAVQAHGALAGIELWHAGSALELNPTRLQPVGASTVPNDAYVLTYPVELDLAGIRRVQRAYVEAALRAADAGFDIVYVYGAHGYLPLQFLSPLANRRDDAYGGSFANRARFWRETLEQVRDAVGGRCAVAVRIGLDESGRGGVPLAEAVPFIRLVDEFVDLWDVNTSAIGDPALDMRPSRLGPQGYQLDAVGRVREATARPLVGVGRFTDPALMARVVRSGVLDLIGGARPSIADPFLPRKIEEGRSAEIRECIGCNICLLRTGIADHIGCTQNATAGEEHRRGWHPERFAPLDAPGDVLVVGGGLRASSARACSACAAPASISSRRTASSAATRAASPRCPASASGGARSTTASRRSAACGASRSCSASASRRTRCARTAPTSSCSRPAPGGRAAARARRPARRSRARTTRRRRCSCRRTCSRAPSRAAASARSSSTTARAT